MSTCSCTTRVGEPHPEETLTACTECAAAASTKHRDLTARNDPVSPAARAGAPDAGLAGLELQSAGDAGPEHVGALRDISDRQPPWCPGGDSEGGGWEFKPGRGGSRGPGGHFQNPQPKPGAEPTSRLRDELEETGAQSPGAEDENAGGAAAELGRICGSRAFTFRRGRLYTLYDRDAESSAALQTAPPDLRQLHRRFSNWPTEATGVYQIAPGEGAEAADLSLEHRIRLGIRRVLEATCAVYSAAPRATEIEELVDEAGGRQDEERPLFTFSPHAYLKAPTFWRWAYLFVVGESMCVFDNGSDYGDIVGSVEKEELGVLLERALKIVGFDAESLREFPAYDSDDGVPDPWEKLDLTDSPEAWKREREAEKRQKAKGKKKWKKRKGERKM